MPIEFKCSQCGKMLKTPDESAGKKGKCPHCQGVMQIPLRSEGASGDAPLSSSPLGGSDPFGDLGRSPGGTTASKHDDPLGLGGFGSPTPPPAASSPPQSSAPLSSAKPAAKDPFAALDSFQPKTQAAPGKPPLSGSPYSSPPTPQGGFASGPSHRSAAEGSDKATLVLVLGILSIVGGVGALLSFCCCPVSLVASIMALGTGIPAWIIGAGENAKYAAGQYGQKGRGETKAGFICGIVGVVLAALAMLAIVGWFVVSLMANVGAAGNGQF